MKKRITAALLALCLLLCPAAAFADEEGVELRLDEDFEPIPVISIMDDSIPVKAAILTDRQSGRVLFEQSADERLSAASITKVMTLLLVMEAIEGGRISLNDQVTASELAASMGGSQIWLEVGETMTVDELLRAVAIASANDASVALAEHVAGAEAVFIEMMNKRAKELGMADTQYKNCTGLDEEGHLTTARDVATVARELVSHPLITEYSTIWMDSLRGGETELVNTNKLVRFYNGATGLKTGTTSLAGSCLAATATRENLSLVAVVLGAPDSNTRFSSARGLLDYGFANFVSVTPPPVADQLLPVKVLHGVADGVLPVYDAPGSFLVEREFEDSLEQRITMAENVEAPVSRGQVLGEVEVVVNGEVLGSYSLRASIEIEEMTFSNAFGRLMGEALKMNR
ncbi:MAG: D-alanyl-D-alanine carboxypeptidase [Oscillospiraceae bacterium]|jgi:D-alanyl-D-alanine carboxypeptidase (penicillin-binding protein 5/6)|nr:D-alanyl-D-alanine carboxypeptidase [Oscillospiraceae bacterium]